MNNSVLTSVYVLLAAAWRRRYLIAVPILLMPLLGFLVSQVTAKKYQANTSFLLQETAKMNPFLEDLAVSTNLKERMAALETLLHSRHVLLGVAADRGMIGPEATDEQREEVVKRLSDALRVVLVGTDLIKIVYETANPQGMAQTLEAVTARFIEHMLAPEQSSLNASESFLNAQLAERHAALLQAETRMAQYKAQHASELPELHAGNVERLRDTRQLLTERKMDLAGSKAALSALTEKLVATNPVIGKLEERIAALGGELAVLRARYTDNHSRVQGVLRQLQSVEAERARVMAETKKLGEEDVQRLWNMVTSADVPDEQGRGQTLLVSQLREVQSARTKVERLEQEVATLTAAEETLDAQVAAYGQNEQNIQALDRDLHVSRKLYEDLLNRFEMARITSALGRFEAPERVKIIDKPYQPSGPVNLPTILFVLSGLLGGVALGVGLAVAAETMDTRVWRKDTLRALANVPVMTRIPPIGRSFDAAPISSAVTAKP